MRIIHGVELKQGSREELLPDYSPEFPHLSSYIELDRYPGRQSPWHWHKEMELFYMEQGELEYHTPRGKVRFGPGSGGLVNSNVLHMTTAGEGFPKVTAFLHLFDPLLISGQRGSVIDQKYVLPLTAAPQIELLPFYPRVPGHARVLDLLLQSFQLSESDYAYELRLREALSGLWREILPLAEPFFGQGNNGQSRSNGAAKQMMAYLHEHFPDKLTVAEIAGSAFLSERECFRVFRECLHTTPLEYLTEYRLQKACRMLAETNDPITSVCQACGLGSSSYFGKVFRERLGCSPMEYRMKWRDRDTAGRKSDRNSEK